jgi:hypothetical protein
MCLARSADHPIDLLVGSIPSLDKLLALIATSNRWRKLSISYADLSAVVKCRAYRGFPALRYLDLHAGLDFTLERAHDEALNTVVIDAPRLSTFKAQYGFGHYPFRVSIPTVTHIHLCIALHRRISEITALLSGLPQLSHLSLRCTRDEVSGSEPVPWTLSLPHLESLALELTPSLTWHILSRARLPSLKHLRIELLSVRRSRAFNTQIELDVDLFLSRCSQLESFTSQAVNFTKFKKILLASRPRFAAFAHDGQPLTNLEVQSLVRDLILGSDSMERVEEFALFDAGQYETDQASVFVDTVVSQCLAMARAVPQTPGPRALRRIDVHSPAPIREQQLQRKLQELYVRGLIPSKTEIQLHYSENRSGNRCTVAEDKWSTSTGPVTAGWQSTFYPFTFGL